MKKMTGIIAMAVLSSAAFANTIVPETSRDGKTKNTSAIAVTQEMRTFVAGEYNAVNTDYDAAGENDTTNMNVYGGWANKMITVEADINMGDSEDKGDEAEDNNEYSVVAGYRINNAFALGLGYTMGSEEDTGSEDEDTTKIEIAGTYKMNDLVLGASFAINSYEQGTTDDSYNTLTVGVGSNANNMSWEAGLTYDMESGDNATEINRGSRFGLFAGMTKVINNIEVDADLSYVTGDAFVTTPSGEKNDYTAIDFNVDAEFIVAGQFYVTPGLFYSSVEDGSEDEKETDLGLSADFGYRAHNIDATIGVDYTLSGEAEELVDTSKKTDFDRMAWKVNVAYNF